MESFNQEKCWVTRVDAFQFISHSCFFLSDATIGQTNNYGMELNIQELDTFLNTLRKTKRKVIFHQLNNTPILARRLAQVSQRSHNHQNYHSILFNLGVLKVYFLLKQVSDFRSIAPFQAKNWRVFVKDYNNH